MRQTRRDCTEKIIVVPMIYFCLFSWSWNPVPSFIPLSSRTS